RRGCGRAVRGHHRGRASLSDALAFPFAASRARRSLAGRRLGRKRNTDSRGGRAKARSERARTDGREQTPRREAARHLSIDARPETRLDLKTKPSLNEAFEVSKRDQSLDTNRVCLSLSFSRSKSSISRSNWQGWCSQSLAITSNRRNRSTRRRKRWQLAAQS